MTKAFEAFMEQYNRTGSEKADGYSRDVFIGLSENEKETVFKLLERELPFSAEWLFLVDKEKAVVVVSEAARNLRGHGHEHVFLLQEHLVKNTDDLTYQQHMVEDYPHYIDNLKPLAVDAIGRTPASAISIAFFKQVILSETNSSAVARAARRLLAAKNLPRDTEDQEANYRRLIRELTGESMPAKLHAIDQIDSLRPHWSEVPVQS